MTLPVPNLDDRTWADLVEEGRGLIPQFAPEWTDHNAHDPGITLIELLAYRTEQELFRINAIGPAHEQAFLGLFGPRFQPAGARPAQALLAYQPESLPRGQLPPAAWLAAGEFLAPWPPPAAAIPPTDDLKMYTPEPRNLRNSNRSTGQPPDAPARLIERPPLFRAAHALRLTGIRVAAVQSFDGREFRDITDVLACVQPAAVWGADPAVPEGVPFDRQPALYIGLDLRLWNPPAPDASRTAAFTLWVVPDGFDLARLTAEPDGDGGKEHGFRPFDPTAEVPPHHGLTVVWEYQKDGAWRPVPTGGAFRDDTRGFTRAGRVAIPLSVFQRASPHDPRVRGATPTEHFYIRCRLAAGRPDAPPRLRGVFPDAVLVEQWDGTETALAAPTVPRDSVLRVNDLRLPDDTRTVIQETYDLVARDRVVPPERWDHWQVDRWSETVCAEDVPTTVPFNVIGIGTGEGGQSAVLQTRTAQPRWDGNAPFNGVSWDEDPPPRVIADSIELWTMEPDWAWQARRGTDWTKRPWRRVADLRFCNRLTPGFTFDVDENRVRFGDGEVGRVPPPGAVIVASYRWSAGETGNVAGGRAWARLADVELPRPGRVPAAPRVRFRNPLPAVGRPPEDTSACLARLRNEFAATERLVELAGAAETLDGVNLTGVPPPPAAVNLLDFECLARTVPGTHVARARAWSGVDPRTPDLVVPGAVTVVVVPTLPAARPEPTPGLLRAVAAHLEARRSIGCRVNVIGPEYRKVRVRATVHTSPRTARGVRDSAAKKLADLLHPLTGGTDRGGWPFGRGVHPGELLRALADVKGVAFVTGLRLAAGDEPFGEAPVALGPRALVDAVIDIAVEEDA